MYYLLHDIFVVKTPELYSLSSFKEHNISLSLTSHHVIQELSSNDLSCLNKILYYFTNIFATFLFTSILFSSDTDFL